MSTPVKQIFRSYINDFNIECFPFFQQNHYDMVTEKNHLSKTVIVSIHNICFCDKLE